MQNDPNKFLAALTTIKVNVGTPGNVRTVSLDGTKTWTVKEVLGIAEMSSEDYDVRVNGQPATGDSPVTADQTILLLAPVRGNLRTVLIVGAGAEGAAEAASTESSAPVASTETMAASTETIVTPAPAMIKINVGTPGNVRPISLDGSKSWTVNEVLGLAEFDPNGYDTRVNGQPANGFTTVTDNQTILLLAPVRGN